MTRISVVLTALAFSTCLAWSNANGQQPRKTSVHGVVRDSATASPVAGAVIEMASPDYSSSTRSDEVGVFRFAELQPGSYRLAIRRIGFKPLSVAISVGSRDTLIVVTMVPNAQRLAPVRVGAAGAGIYGVVAAVRDLRPISEARVSVAGTKITVETDSVGAFFVPIKKPGTYVVRVSRASFAEELFPIVVPENQVVDASTLLDSSNVRPPPGAEGLWQDFDQRLRWRGMNSAVVTGSEVRSAGGGMLDAIRASPSFVRKGLVFGSKVCVLIDGMPKPSWPLNAFGTAEVRAIEVYGGDKEVAMFMKSTWPPRAECSETGIQTRAIGSAIVKYVVIWTKR